MSCGTQFGPAEGPPEHCLLCEDDRYCIRTGVQKWTTLAQLEAGGFHNEFTQLERGLTEIATQPHFGIGQRIFLVQSPAGNVLWDCLGYFDLATRAKVVDLGGISAIAFSHPHFYCSMVEWSDAFGGAPIYIPLSDSSWVRRQSPSIRLWKERADILPGFTLVQCGGHFDGSAVLHWTAGAEDRGVLLVGDTISISQDKRTVGFMRSNPNWIPLGAGAATGIAQAVQDFPYARMYGGFPGMVITEGADNAVQTSLDRYLRWIR